MQCLVNTAGESEFLGQTVTVFGWSSKKKEKKERKKNVDL